ncbi:TPA: hypothetical protein ACKR0U_001125 [Proteus mirabilis]|uniref:hypothetical protein n=2 Tax=Proteus TaxID=583 RepID=UPI0018C4F433|nr:hypothetical protein [Proteus mirabilis]EKU2371010.1 hypothetical protein [Proteus mirabilis]EKU7917370.1 hypothetical protein [Proteus mirabilis]EKU7921388.1 hypothetical protein [Proteus mirabilis]EKU8688610.1 hypothetical protein [Proteus mirabilis]EKU8703440.1 hypothetical protein [Proteus mirabilis]
MSAHKYEVVKELVYYVEGLHKNVTARIIKDTLTNMMTWECSHYFCDSNGQRAYESNHPTELVEECESDLDSYMNKFNADTAEENTEY